MSKQIKAVTHTFNFEESDLIGLRDATMTEVRYPVNHASNATSPGLASEYVGGHGFGRPGSTGKIVHSPFGRPGDMLECDGLTVKILSVWTEFLSEVHDPVTAGVLEYDGIVDVKCYGGDPVEINGIRFDDGSGDFEYKCEYEAFMALWDLRYGNSDKDPLVWVYQVTVINDEKGKNANSRV